jgi:hypothetical protein
MSRVFMTVGHFFVLYLREIPGSFFSAYIYIYTYKVVITFNEQILFLSSLFNTDTHAEQRQGMNVLLTDEQTNRRKKRKERIDRKLNSYIQTGTCMFILHKFLFFYR